MAKFFTWGCGLFFFVYGMGFVLFPEFLSFWVTDSVPATSSGVTDMRATYGGMSAAMGLTILLLAKQESQLTRPLLVTVMVLWGMAIGRIIGMFIDGDPNLMMFIYLAAECLFGGLALWLFGIEKKKALGGGQT